MKLRDSKKVMGPPKICMYGPAGTGKTALAETLGKKAELVDCDGGARTGLTLEDKWKEDRLEIEVKDCVERDPFNPTSYLKAKNYLKSFLQEPGYEALILDSWTTYMDGCINQVMKNQGRPGRAPQLQEWGMIIRELEESLSIIRAIPRVVVVIAHRMYVEDEDSGSDKAPSNSTVLCAGRKLPDKFVAAFDEVWYMKPTKTPGGNIDFQIETLPDPHSIKRSRLSLPDKCKASEGLPNILRKAGYDLDKKEE